MVEGPRTIQKFWYVESSLAPSLEVNSSLWRGHGSLTNVPSARWPIGAFHIQVLQKSI